MTPAQFLLNELAILAGGFASVFARNPVLWLSFGASIFALSVGIDHFLNKNGWRGTAWCAASASFFAIAIAAGGA